MPLIFRGTMLGQCMSVGCRVSLTLYIQNGLRGYLLQTNKNRPYTLHPTLGNYLVGELDYSFLIIDYNGRKGFRRNNYDFLGV